MSFPTLAPGQQLAGRYRIVAPIGAGETGEVYAALDHHGERECALKILSAQILGAPAAWSTFQDTCRTVSSASADAIARVTDFGLDANAGRPFFVAERIGFPSLAELVSSRGPIPLALWLAALDVLAPSLDAAARLGVPHGDLKPQNLFFSPDHPSWARITDFGMAAVRGAALQPGLGAALGWAAPEQMSGAAPSRAADVFALGLITFYALSARHYLRSMWQGGPRREDVLEELQAARPHASQHAAALGASLPPALDDWFVRALHPDPAQRFASAVDAYKALPGAAAPLALAGAGASPGVAAAIAQPLVFQDLPLRPSREPPDVAHAPTVPDPGTAGNAGLGLATIALAPTAPAPALGEQALQGTLAIPASEVPGFGQPLAAAAFAHSPGQAPAHAAAFAHSEPAQAAPAAAAPVGATNAPRTSAPSLHGATAKKPPIALLAAGGAAALLLVGLVGWAAASLLFGDPPGPREPAAVAGSARAEAPSAVPAVASSPPVVRTRAAFECTPEPCEWVLCDGKELPKGVFELEVTPGKHTCSASRYGYRTAVMEFNAAEGELNRVRFELLSSRAAGAKKAAPTAPEPRSTSASKSVSAAPTAAKASAATAKPGAAKSSKKQKCGTFINPCR